MQWIGYRKKVILGNLNIAFPHKSQQEKRKLRAQFYKNFSESIFESFKMFTENPSTIHKEHSELINYELLERIYEEDKELVILMPHIFNWEWIGFWAKKCPQKNVYAVFKPLRNAFLNQKLEQARFRIGGKGIPVREFFSFVRKNKHSRDNLYLIIADQSPHHSKIKYSTTFFDVETPVFSGYDFLIKVRNARVVYCKPKKVKQSYYTYEFIEIKPENEAFAPNEAVEAFTKLVEQTIIEQPSNWLWSHKRWKYKKGVDF